MSRKCSRKKKIDRAVDNVDFQLFLTQILYLNSKRVKIGGEHREYLNKVLGIEVAYEDLQERCSAEMCIRDSL